MTIGGLLKFSLIDYPGKIAAVIFTQGCNFRCGYCHNPRLVDPRRFEPSLSGEEVLQFLRRRQGRLQGVVVSGGEPTIHHDLPDWLRRLRDLGYAVKLDTNGGRPDVVRRLLNEQLLDFIAMDVKAPLGKYRLLTGGRDCSAQIQESIHLIQTSGIDYQFRTTFVPWWLDKQDFREIWRLLKGDPHYCLQPFVGEGDLLDTRWQRALPADYANDLRVIEERWISGDFDFD